MNFMWLQKKYISLASGSFRNFKWKSEVANLSCPYCGDSTEDSRKARGYFLKGKGTYYYFCHKCGATANFEKFFTEHAPHLLNDYKVEKIQEHVPVFEFKKQRELRKLEQAPVSFTDLIPIEQSDVACTYMESRDIPRGKWNRFGFTENFHDLVKSLISPAMYEAKYEKLPKDRRIIIPFRKRNGDLFALQGRALSSTSTLRYITIKIDEDFPKIFGLDRFNPAKQSFVTEGPFDSTFLPNACAMAGADMNDAARKMFVPSNTIMIYDNEPRSRIIRQKMLLAAQGGFSVMVWNGVDEKFKDINDMISEGLFTRQTLLSMIAANSNTGLKAKLSIQSWSKAP